MMFFIDNNATNATSITIERRLTRVRINSFAVTAVNYPRFDREREYIRAWRAANLAASIAEIRRLAREVQPLARVKRACLINYRLLKQPPARFAFYQGDF